MNERQFRTTQGFISETVNKRDAVETDTYQRISTRVHSGRMIEEITALRGIAVLLVVACHFNIPHFQSGFFGVDVFFVISGFLITGILVREYNDSQLKNPSHGRISLRNFYLRRIKRIAPASIVTLISVAGYYEFFGNSLRKSQVTSDLLWSAFGFANSHFQFLSTNYFASNSAKSPLLHYWSLAVEEQFYFVWPLLILTAIKFHRLKIRGQYIRWNLRVTVLTISLTLLSCLFWIIYSNLNPTASYFMTQARAWELGFGGIFGMLVQNKVRIFERVKIGTISRLSILTIFASVFLVSNSNIAFSLFVPVTATGLFLYSVSINQWSPNLKKKSKIFQPFVFVGKISYSLYLWHYPLFVIFSERGYLQGPVGYLILISLTFVLSCISFKFVELPFLEGKFATYFVSRDEQYEKTESKMSRSGYIVSVLVLALGISSFPGYIYNYSNRQALTQNWKSPDLNSLFPDQGTNSNNISVSEAQTRNDSLTATNSYDPDTEAKWRTTLLQSAKNGKVSIDLLAKMPLLAFKKNNYETMCFKGVNQPCTILSFQGTHKRVLLLGDSRMTMILPPIVDYFRKRGNWSVDTWALPGCPILKISSESLGTADCVDRQKYIAESIDKFNPNLVIVSERFHEDFSYYPTLINFLKAKNLISKTIALVPFPYLKNAPESCFGKDGTYSITCFSVEANSSRVTSRVGAIFEQSGIKHFNFQNIICTASLLCPPVINGVYVYRDKSHINADFSESLAPVVGYFIDTNFPSDV